MKVVGLLLIVASSSFAAPVDSPVPTTSSGGVVPVSPSKTPMTTSAVDYKRFRDPFKEPAYIESKNTRSELERYAVTEFKVTGIVTGPLRMRAMLLAPDGKTHYVSEKMKLGMRDGVITRITTKTVVVREKVVNPLGEVELFDTEIGMDPNTNVNNGN